MGWVGSFALEFFALPDVAVEGMGVAGVETGSAGIELRSLQLAGGVTGSAVIPVTDPDLIASGIAAVELQIRLGSGTLGPFWPPRPAWEPQLTRGALPVEGIARLCLLTLLCPGHLDLPLSAGGGATGIGVGGLLAAGSTGTARISVEAAPWTLRTASVSVPTAGGGALALASAGWVHGPLSFTQSTALADGELSLVTPVQVTSEAGQHFAGFGRLRVRLLPEPTRGLLLGSGLLALARLARARARPGSRAEVSP